MGVLCFLLAVFGTSTEQMIWQCLLWRTCVTRVFTSQLFNQRGTNTSNKIYNKKITGNTWVYTKKKNHVGFVNILVIYPKLREEYCNTRTGFKIWVYLTLQRGNIKMWFSHYIVLILDHLYLNFLPRKSKKSPGAPTCNNQSKEKSIIAVQLWQRILFCNVSWEMQIKDFGRK